MKTEALLIPEEWIIHPEAELLPVQIMMVVPDVSAFPGHITCDGRSASEIVVPVFGRGGALIAVFDVDSERPGTFDQADQAGLEGILGWFARG